MLLNIPSKQGQIQVTEDGFLRIANIFKQVQWQTPCANVTKITIQPGTISDTLIIHSSQPGTFQCDMVTKANVAKLLALFPDIEQNTGQKSGKEWYQDNKTRTHIETYTDQKKMQKEVEAAAHYGWYIQTSTGTAGHVNVGRTATAAALTGGWSLLLGASRSKDKITLSFARTPEWLEKNT